MRKAVRQHDPPDASPRRSWQHTIVRVSLVGLRACERSALSRFLLTVASQPFCDQCRIRRSFSLTAAGQPWILTRFPIKRLSARQQRKAAYDVPDEKSTQYIVVVVQIGQIRSAQDFMNHVILSKEETSGSDASSPSSHPPVPFAGTTGRLNGTVSGTSLP